MFATNAMLLPLTQFGNCSGEPFPKGGLLRSGSYCGAALHGRYLMAPASAQLRVSPERKDGGHPALCNAPPQWLRMRHQSHQSHQCSPEQRMWPAGKNRGGEPPLDPPPPDATGLTAAHWLQPIHWLTDSQPCSPAADLVSHANSNDCATNTFEHVQADSLPRTLDVEPERKNNAIV